MYFVWSKLTSICNLVSVDIGKHNSVLLVVDIVVVVTVIILITSSFLGFLGSVPYLLVRIYRRRKSSIILINTE